MLLVDSYGLLALALDREPAAAVLGCKAGTAVTLVPAGAEPTGPDGPGTRVELTDKGDR